MTTTQRRVLLCYAAIVIALLLFPPFYADVPSGGARLGLGHAFFLDPPAFNDRLSGLVAYRTLFVQILGLTLAFGAAVVAGSTRKKNGASSETGD